ncbi:RagB/SusD family nutrient uptake outer membrane protein [Flavobacterium sp. WLB]|uniref:RagB/SusD family nutrient uptake outer membrane protein n=1 Tax=unclassified Flavobacterium TaxID=196869 RepID=UPI0006AB8B28|nr:MULTISPECIES: RagB/SusD family nutrient uptake outer membrane protein [unclassified Flavobacterium]KOP38387.1 carbohydrate-binding protein SusD [Flavobacterium sp. VMW]OWU92474.1 carbohydrate-binding protein SusD [Flavobacterium sp. NLM]PUU70781.1 RagB/SusD family nutrient uptake outer membrane protein [Flavobacterium sp. WLB]
MKTKLNIYILSALVLVLGASCSDNFLEDVKPIGQYDDSFYQSQARVQAYVDNQYFDFFAAFKSPTSTVIGVYNDVNTKLTEEQGGVQDYTNPSKLLNSPDVAKDYFGAKIGTGLVNNAYTRIRECNNLIEDIDVKGASLDKTFRDQAKGQMYYMRAIQYFDLMRTYGGVPIVTKVMNPSTDDESIKLPRAKVSEVVAQIVADLDMAASLLPGDWNSANYGRFTKGAALAQKSRVLLTFASPLFNKSWDGSNERWQAALDAGLAAESVLTQNGYGLYGNSIKEWNDMFLIDNVKCREAITVQLLSSSNSDINFNINNNWEKSIRLPSQGGSGGISAPKEMIDLFPMKNGSRPTAANGYNDFTFFLNRDPRFYRTFAFSGVKWAYKENSNAVLWSYRWLDNKNKPYFNDLNTTSTSPAFVRKMTNTTATNAVNYAYSPTDIMEYRYAELLLNIAECYAALGQTGNTLAYLGKIRARVGIPAANNYGIGTLADKYAAIEAVLYERRVELAYEGKRYWDVQRWKLYSDEPLGPNTSNSCQKLGLAPINGTQRTGNYLQYKTTATAADPLAASRAGILADPDSANFETQLSTLAAYYNDNFVLATLVTPMDNVSGAAVKIKFNPNYYISGLNTTALSSNPWLIQTIGWNDNFGGAGTFNYQE